MFGEDGSDVIDATIQNTFTAKINGTSYVGAYQLIIYENNDSATEVYNTGVVELEENFYGCDYEGNVNDFEVVVPTNKSEDTPHTTL